MADYAGLNRKFIWGLLLWVGMVVALALLADVRQVVDSLKSFQLGFLPVMLALTGMNYLFRFIKWQYFLRQIDVRVPAGVSARIFLSGLAMSVTPGKVGEILKSLLLKEWAGAPVSRTAPVIFAERLTDGFGVLILSASGIVFFRHGWEVLVSIGLGMGLLFLLAKTPVIHRLILKVSARIPFVSGFTGHLEIMLQSAGRLLTLRTFSFTMVITVVSWFFECIAFYYVFAGLGYGVSIWAVTFTLSFASIVGGVTMLPGGLGAAEGSIMGLLVKVVGVPVGTAAAATILIRFSTLWFGVAIGVLALVFSRRRTGAAGPGPGKGF